MSTLRLYQDLTLTGDLIFSIASYLSANPPSFYHCLLVLIFFLVEGVVETILTEVPYRYFFLWRQTGAAKTDEADVGSSMHAVDPSYRSSIRDRKKE